MPCCGDEFSAMPSKRDEVSVVSCGVEEACPMLDEVDGSSSMPGGANVASAVCGEVSGASAVSG